MDQANINNIVRQGLAALHAQRPQEAKQLLTNAIGAGAVNPAIFLALAMANRAAGDYGAAKKAADKSIELEPRNPRALLLKGDIYLSEGQKRAATAFYREAFAAYLPHDHTPDLAADFRRAKAELATLEADFEGHLKSEFSKNETHLPDSIRKSLDMMFGRRKAYYPEPNQYYFPDLPVREFYDEAEFDWVAELEAATQDIQAELQEALKVGMAFDAYLVEEKDRPNHDFHGMNGNTDWGAYYLWYNGEPVAEHQARCPKTVAALNKIPLLFSGRRSPNVLFSRLKPGAKIPPHTGMVNTRLICHLPLIVPDGCGFRVGNTVREWQPGKVWMFDDTIEHEAWNNSDEERIILLFEIWKPELSVEEQDAVTALFQAVDSYS